MLVWKKLPLLLLPEAQLGVLLLQLLLGVVMKQIAVLDVLENRMHTLLDPRHIHNPREHILAQLTLGTIINHARMRHCVDIARVIVVARVEHGVEIPRILITVVCDPITLTSIQPVRLRHAIFCIIVDILERHSDTHLRRAHFIIILHGAQNRVVVDGTIFIISLVRFLVPVHFH